MSRGIVRARTRLAAAARTPKGMHDVLWPESARWEGTVARFAALVEGAGYGLTDHARSSSTPASSCAASARAARSSARRCTSSRTATAS